MAETRGVVVVAVALIGAAATVVAALIARSDGDTPSPPVAAPTASGTAVSGTPLLPTPTVPVQPAPPAPEQTIPPAQALPGDLGVSRPITRPACDGSYLVFVGAATDPSTYQIRVQDLLDAHPDSEYLRAIDTCPSLRPRDDAGHEIYGVYYGPFTTQEKACQTRNSRGADSYVKVLDTITDSDVIIQC